MRAIDADALLPKLYVIKQAEEQIYGKASWDFVNKCIHAVEDAPTIEPERKKGKWLQVKSYPMNDGNGGIVAEACCSECELYSTQLSSHGYVGYDYCPRCGADMRGDSDESD